MNIPNDETMKLYDLGFQIIYGGEPENYPIYQSEVAKYSIGKVGLIDMYMWLAKINNKTPVPGWEE